MIKYRNVLTVTVESTLSDKEVDRAKEQLKESDALQAVEQVLSIGSAEIMRAMFETILPNDTITVEFQSADAWEVQDE